MTPTVLAFTIPTPSSNPTTNTYHHKQQRHCSSTVLYGRPKGKLTQSILVQQDKNEEKEKSNTSTFQKEDKEGSYQAKEKLSRQEGREKEDEEEGQEEEPDQKRGVQARNRIKQSNYQYGRFQ